MRLGQVEPVCRFITEELAALMGVERVSVWFFNDRQDELHLQDLFRLSCGTHEQGAVLHQTAFANEFHHLLTSRYVDAHEPYTDPRTQGYVEPYLKPNGITSMLDVVVRQGEELLGLICMEHVGRSHFWQESEILLAGQLGDQLSLTCAMRELKRREAELRGLNAELEQRVQVRSQELQTARMSLAATEQAAALSSMLSQVAHELATPIGNALLAAGTLQGDALRLHRQLEQGQLGRRALLQFFDDQQHAASLVERSLQMASERLHALKRFSADSASDQRRCFELRRSVLDLIELLRPALERHPVLLQWKVEIDPGLQLDSRPGQLGQALVNLINNALVHAFEGRTHGCLRISARLLGATQLRLSVADDGCGIAPADHARVFEPWVTSKAGRGGTGQGLPIVRQIVERQLGGLIHLESALGAGTTFHLDLPLRAP
ncbi:ATP-binding protein [Inhella sp.]|uniref:ATP-binding protein n=1 Tax=Inhella sp. TaxID=1921806 RepID=UPI0035B12148